MPLELVTANEKTIEQLEYDKKVAAEEVLHKNPTARILPTQPAPAELPSTEFMIPILHKACEGIAFYYTHVPQKLEMMTASRARTLGGKLIEPSSAMICGSCNMPVDPKDLQVSKLDYERAHGQS